MIYSLKTKNFKLRLAELNYKKIIGGVLIGKSQVEYK